MQKREGLCFILSAPSGVGKTTHAKNLLVADPYLRLSVSTTTRAPRLGEVDGVDYFFVEPATFQVMEEEGAFLEWAHVFSHRYGTPKAFVEEQLAKGHDILFDIDWQGARMLRSALGKRAVSIFLLPPSREALEKRLVERGEGAATLASRLASFEQEASHAMEYDYIVVNDDFASCANVLSSIVTAAQHQSWLQSYRLCP